MGKDAREGPRPDERASLKCQTLEALAPPLASQRGGHPAALLRDALTTQARLYRRVAASYGHPLPRPARWSTDTLHAWWSSLGPRQRARREVSDLYAACHAYTRLLPLVARLYNWYEPPPAALADLMAPSPSREAGHRDAGYDHGDLLRDVVEVTMVAMGVGPVRAALMRHLEQRSRKKQGAASTNKTKQDGNAPARRSIEAWLRKQARRPNDVAALARAYRDDVLYAYRRTHNNELPTGFVTWKQYWSVGTSKGTRDRNIARRVRDIIYDLDEAAATNLPSR